MLTWNVTNYNLIQRKTTKHSYSKREKRVGDNRNYSLFHNNRQISVSSGLVSFTLVQCLPDTRFLPYIQRQHKPK